MSGSDTPRTGEVPCFAKELERELYMELERRRRGLSAWNSVFGTSQLPHADARLEAAEHRADMAERELNAANNRITELEQELRAAYERT